MADQRLVYKYSHQPTYLMSIRTIVNADYTVLYANNDRTGRCYACFIADRHVSFFSALQSRFQSNLNVSDTVKGEMRA